MRPMDNAIEPTAHGDRMVLAAKVFVTTLCLSMAFVLYWKHMDGAAYFLGIISGSPAQGFAAAAVQKSAARAVSTDAGGSVTSVETKETATP